MTTFQQPAIGLGLSDYSTDATTPTTPRAPAPPLPKPLDTRPAGESTQSAPTTPTNANMVGMSGQRPLPGSPFNNSFSSPQHASAQDDSESQIKAEKRASIQSTESQDVEMADSDGEAMGSDAESVDTEGRSSKKKKGQRFFCTDFPPCKLSFTRSEHLARHIRKHTGERPFQCHCSRRFSRLDNLRQHAQTVHVNEDIPGDSLAATGTRFQRQIRTDRVGGSRASGNRSRNSIGGGPGGRGHARNLSASSVGSTASTISRDDARRRPPPLMMANDPAGRNRLSLELLRNQASTPPGQGSFFREESEGISTPTSTTFSTGQNSPGGYGSALGSPASAMSRASGFFDGRTHNRRLSVPSGPAPFQSPHATYGSPYLSPLASSNASQFSNISSSFASPVGSGPVIHQQTPISAAEEWRRRTWHPSSQTYVNYSRPATSGLTYHQTPDAPRPAFAPQPAALTSSVQRLPGIETFDQLPPRSSPSGAAAAPLQLEPSGRPPIYPGPSTQANPGPNDRRGHASWDMSLHQNLTKLDLASGTPPTEQAGPTRGEMMHPPDDQMTHHARGPQVVFSPDRPQRPAEEGNAQYTPARTKRQGWYAGPPSAGQPQNPPHGTSPGESSSSEGLPRTPSNAPAEHHPAIMPNTGYMEPDQRRASPGANYGYQGGGSQPNWPLPAGPSNTPQSPRKDTEMSGLEVLVAVATSQENATAAPNA